MEREEDEASRSDRQEAEFFETGSLEKQKVGDERWPRAIKDTSTVSFSAALIHHHQGPMSVSRNRGCGDGTVSQSFI